MNSLDNNNWQEFVKVCNAIESLDELNMFFDTLLTVSEKIELAKRLTILRELLTSNRTQRDLAKQLQVSLANVTRGSNVLKNTNFDLKKILKLRDN